MKGRITRIKHREIPVPSAARFYGRQSMTRTADIRATFARRANIYTMIRIHGLVPIKSLLYGRSLTIVARFSPSMSALSIKSTLRLSYQQ